MAYNNTSNSNYRTCIAPTRERLGGKRSGMGKGGEGGVPLANTPESIEDYEVPRLSSTPGKRKNRKRSMQRRKRTKNTTHPLLLPFPSPLHLPPRVPHFLCPALHSLLFPLLPPLPQASLSISLQPNALQHSAVAHQTPPPPPPFSHHVPQLQYFRFHSLHALHSRQQHLHWHRQHHKSCRVQSRHTALCRRQRRIPLHTSKET